MQQAIEYSGRSTWRYLNWSQWLMVAGTFFYNRIEIAMSAIALLLLLIYRRKIYQSYILKYLLIAYGVSVITIAFCGYSYDKFWQQAFIISIMFLIGEQIFLHNKRYISEIFRKYILFSYYTCCLAILQEAIWIAIHFDISEILDMQWLTGFQGMTVPVGIFLRARAMCLEGGHLGPLLVPSLIYLLYYKDCYHIINSWKKTAIIIATSLLTGSPIPVLALMAIAYVYLVRMFPRIKIVFIFMGICMAIYAYSFLQKSDLSSYSDLKGVDGIIVRLRDTSAQIQHLDSREAALETNLSTAVLMSNLYSALNAPSRIIGTGLGTNSQNYNHVYGGYKLSEEYSVTSLNNEDAYCLGVRLFSEFGIIGLGIFVFFLYKCFKRGGVITSCLIFVLLPYLMKGGTYFGYGIQFYLLMVYYSSKMKGRLLT